MLTRFGSLKSWPDVNMDLVIFCPGCFLVDLLTRQIYSITSLGYSAILHGAAALSSSFFQLEDLDLRLRASP